MDDLHMENATEDKREEIKQKLRQYTMMVASSERI